MFFPNAMNLLRGPFTGRHPNEVQSPSAGTKRRRVEGPAEGIRGYQTTTISVDLTSTPHPRGMAIENSTERRSKRRVETQSANVHTSELAGDRDERDLEISRLNSKVQNQRKELSRLQSDLQAPKLNHQGARNVRSRHDHHDEVSGLKYRLQVRDSELREALQSNRELIIRERNLSGELKKRENDTDIAKSDQDHQLRLIAKETERVEAHNRILVSESRKKDKEIRALRSEQASILDQNEKLNGDVRRFQEASFNALEDPHWMPMDSDTMLDGFSKLRKTVNNIAKSNAVEDFCGLNHMQNERQIKLRDILGPTVSFQSEGVEGLKELVGVKHAPRLCLASLISDTVHDSILSRPFFPLELKDNKSKALAGGDTKELSTLHAMFLDHDEQKAHRWRSDTLRLLNPTYVSGTRKGQQQLMRMQTTIASAARGLAETFNDQELPGLLRDMDETERQNFVNELTELFVLAGKTSLRLWCQRPDYRCQDLADLAQEPFLTSSELLQPHPLHKHSDPFDTSLDGKLPKIVVHPAIFSLGTHKGEHYDQSRLLEKAVVWLDV